jgi:hypothetical protein
MDMQTLIQSLRDRGRKMVSLDTPADADLYDLGADLVGGFTPGVGTALSARDFERARREGDTLGMVLGAAGMVPVAGGAARAVNKARKGAKATEAANDAVAPAVVKALRAPKQTVDNPQRMAFPGIYKRPDEIAQEASQMVAPENPMLKRLFGVTRDDLYEMSRSRTGNIEPVLPGAAANPKGSAAAESVMNRRNENRLLNTLGEAEKHPDLYKGMVGWYVMDPAFQRLKQLVGEEEAIRQYSRFNNLSGMASPGSDVLTEFNRGTAANWLANEGRFDDFLKYGGMPAAARTGSFPDDMRAVMGHPYHKTAQATPMQKYLAKGELEMSSPKVPMYIQASGVPETGFQTRMPVGDAHWSRAVGLGDTRTNQAFGASVSNPEMSQLGPWWRDRIAAKAGLDSVPAQALAWGTFAKQTGVDTPVGAPKLELLSQQIEKAAKRMNVSPETARDLILTGKAHAGFVDPALLGTLAAGAGGAAAIAALRNRRKEEEAQAE